LTIQTDALHDAALAHITAKGQLLEVQTIERAWGEQLVFTNAPPNLGSFFMLMLRHADKTFLVYGEERYTFGEVWARSNALAAALQNRGVKKGDRVVIAMRNYPEWIFSFIAIALVGGIAVPLNAWWVGSELLDAIDDAGAHLAIVDQERHERLTSVGAVVDQIVVRGGEIGDSAVAYGDFVGDRSATPTAVEVDPDNDATIFYTSGSTSYPKGAVSTHRALTNAMFNFAAFGLAQQEVQKSISGEEPSTVQAVTLLTVPLFHVTGCHSTFMMSVLIGRKIVLLDKWDPERALASIEKERVTTFMGVPTMSRDLTEHPDRDRYDISSLVEINAGGAAMPPAHVRRLLERFPDKRPGTAYGTTESNGTGTLNVRDGYLAHPNSAGRAKKPLAELAILNDEGQVLPDGAVGEIAVRAVTLARGYWNRPDDTAAAFLKDGWFRTGDLGVLDNDYLTIVGRKKDMILRGGENVSCQEVEACVFGAPDERLGESVHAVIYAKHPDRFDEEEHRALLAKSLAAFKLPTLITVLGEPLPRLGSGKIDKLTIKESYAKEAA